MAKAAVRSKAVVLLLISCLMYSPLFVGLLCLSWFVLHYSFAVIMKR